MGGPDRCDESWDCGKRLLESWIDAPILQADAGWNSGGIPAKWSFATV
jgi:hypothetical protein